MSTSTSREAVVVGADLNALGIVRSLALADVPMRIVGDDADGAALHTRHGRKILVSETAGEPLIEALLRIADDARDAPVLFLTEEKAVRTVSADRDRIVPRFRIRLPSHEQLIALMHKASFQEQAAQLGCAIPAAVAVRSAADLDRAAQLRFPCVLKPAYKDYAYGARFAKAYVVDGIDVLRQRYAEIAPVLPDMIVQQWIDGEDSDVYFCLAYVGADAEPVMTFAGRKLRCWPQRIGGTASCVGVTEHADVLTRLTLDFFRAAAFTGMGSMEFKRDRRDGRFYMVEPTVGRTDFQQEVATLNGANIPLAAYRYEAGLGTTPTRAVRIPHMWREPLTDAWARERQPERVEDGFRHRSCDAYFRVDDPMPWVHYMGGRVRSKLDSALSRLRGRRADPA